MKRLRIDFLNSQMTQPYPFVIIVIVIVRVVFNFFLMFCSVLNQTVREKVLNSFRSGKIQFLITTDVVNRGIDIPNLNYVLNYDFPTNLVTYISSFTFSFSFLNFTSIESVELVETTPKDTLAASSHATCLRSRLIWCSYCRRTVRLGGNSLTVDQVVPKLLQELADEQKRLNEFGAWEV